ncbi:hypothetical protein U1Q18_011665 [Sarracenia purpurea var. burkii]
MRDADEVLDDGVVGLVEAMKEIGIHRTADQRINGEEILIIIIINAKNSVSHPMDVIGVVIVAGQGHDAAKSSCVDERRMTPEVGPEIAHGGIAFEDRSEGLELVARSSIAPLQTKKIEDRRRWPPAKPEATPSEEARAVARPTSGDSRSGVVHSGAGERQ